MTGPDRYDDASRDHERFENELVAQDRDTARIETADIDEAHAWMLVEELISQDVVTPVAESQSLVHEPSGESFRSEKALALFHKGWKAGYDAVAERRDDEPR